VYYESAGTVEFVAGQDRSFYFLEMNTRLQVEHPVTEMITGIDLVEQMIRVAAGEKLSITQDQVKLNGWAVESRIYAEDPYRNFLPSIGRLVTYRPPAEGPAGEAIVRNDTGVFEGGEISLYYDPMIAKLVTWAPTRAAAIAAQADALDAFAIDGIQHNIPFLAALMQHPRWQSGNLSTGFIAEEYPDGFKARVPEGEAAGVMAAVAAFADHLLNQRKRRISGQMRQGHRVSFDRERVVLLGDSRHDVEVVDEDGRIAVRLFDAPGGTEIRTHTVVSSWVPGQPVFAGRVDGRPVHLLVRAVPNGWQIAYRGIAARAHVYTRREAELAALMPVKVAADSGKKLTCPMPGLVKSIAVSVGQEVKAGESLCVIEAMKMENVLRAERDGKVKAIAAKPGDSLAVDAVIMEFE
jgi:propionyl-CoA carboxylase alpha chain